MPTKWDFVKSVWHVGMLCFWRILSEVMDATTLASRNNAIKHANHLIDYRNRVAAQAGLPPVHLVPTRDGE